MIELIDVSRTVTSGAGAPHHPPSDDASHRRGRTVSITGPSGSGKSTLLGLIAGLDTPTTGRILLDGIDITAIGEEALARLRGEKIGIVFQFFHLIPTLTALENVLVPLELAGARQRRDTRARAHRRGRPRRPRASLPVAALRRRAAAGRDRPGAGERSADRAGRRADRQPRQRDRHARSSTCWSPSTGSAAGRWCWSRTIPTWPRWPTRRSRCGTDVWSAGAA